MKKLDEFRSLLKRNGMPMRMHEIVPRVCSQLCQMHLNFNIWMMKAIASTVTPNRVNILLINRPFVDTLTNVFFSCTIEFREALRVLNLMNRILKFEIVAKDESEAQSAFSTTGCVHERVTCGIVIIYICSPT